MNQYIKIRYNLEPNSWELCFFSASFLRSEALKEEMWNHDPLDGCPEQTWIDPATGQSILWSVTFTTTYTLKAVRKSTGDSYTHSWSEES